MDAVHQLWTGLLEGEVAMTCIDAESVCRLRVKMPALSSRDAADIV